jgi:polyhydroxyalkanoate synthesis regulator protein
MLGLEEKVCSLSLSIKYFSLKRLTSPYGQFIYTFLATFLKISVVFFSRKVSKTKESAEKMFLFCLN